MNDKQQATMSQALTRAQETQQEAVGKTSQASGKAKLELMLQKVLAHEPQVKMTHLDFVRGLFEALEVKRKEGATYEELAALLKDDLDVTEATLKTMMSKIRVEKGIRNVTCPCCGAKVPETKIKEQYRANLALESASDMQT